ncbi:MAG: hypothetical protein ACI4HI_14025 [Lachnospiraceae bacterium]
MWKEKFHYTYENEKLSMWVDGVTFSYEWLLHIGASTKTTDKKNGNAGYFGEGFKVASLCAHRDFNWNIQMSSGDWNLDVVTVKQTIDQTEVEMLAYDVKSKEKEETSRLELNPVSEEDFQLFQDAITSFYYIGNPLLGEKIWEGDEGSVYVCKVEQYKRCYVCPQFIRFRIETDERRQEPG